MATEGIIPKQNMECKDKMLQHDKYSNKWNVVNCSIMIINGNA